MNITESHQYGVYERVVEALQKAGYSVTETKSNKNIIEADVRGSVSCGYIFVVADPRPGCLWGLIGAISPGWGKIRFDSTAYGRIAGQFELIEPRFKRKGYDFDSYHYWPEGSLVGGIAAIGDEPASDNKWLEVLESVVGADVD